MKKNETTVKVNLELPREVITTILNKGLSRFEEAKYLLLAHYYQHQFFIVGVKEMNKYLGVKDSKGRDMRLNMIHWNILTPTESAKVKRNNKGQFFKKGYDIYQPACKDENIGYTLLSEDARAIVGKYSGDLLEALNVVAEKANAWDVKRYNVTKEEYKNIDVMEISNDLKSIINQEVKPMIEKIETLSDVESVENTPFFNDEEDDDFGFIFPNEQEKLKLAQPQIIEQAHPADEFDSFIITKLKSARVQPVYWNNAIKYIKDKKHEANPIELGKLISISTGSTQVIIKKIQQYLN